MKKQSEKLAYCSMTAALSVVVMLVTGFTGLGTYVGSLMAALLLVPVQQRYGTGSALCVWVVTGVLGLMLLTDQELALVYVTIFGWYPALRPYFLRIPGGLSVVCRLLAFNAAAVGTYAALIWFMSIGDELGGAVFMVILLLLGNAIFLMEDLVLIPRVLPVLLLRFSGHFRKIS